METQIENELMSAYIEGFAPPWSGSIYDWCGENIELPPNYAIKGQFDISLSPYLIEPFKDMLNSEVQQINLEAATQTGKTLLSELALPYIIVNDPGPVLKLHQSDEMSQTFTETRLIPVLKMCKLAKQMLGDQRQSVTKKGVHLPHMSIKISGAKENVLHGLSIRYLFMDEVHLYEKAVVDKACARTTAFAHNKKILVTSQPGIEGDQLSEQNTGLIYEWSWLCPHCKTQQLYIWDKQREGTKDTKDRIGITWTKIKDKDGEVDIEKTGDTAILKCAHCTGSVEDNVNNRRYLSDTGKYMQIGDRGDHSVHTYRWNGFVNQGFSFKKGVIQYLQALDAHKTTGTTDALRIWTQQVWGQEWRRSTVVDPSQILTLTFNPSDTWPEEIFRCLTVDYQRRYGQKFYCVTAWSKTEMRVLDYGYKQSWDEIESVQKQWKIPYPAVFVDSGYEAMEVYKTCFDHSKPTQVGKRIELYGWFALKGDGGHDNYPHKDGTRRFYSQEVKASISANQYARLYLWSNFHIKTSFAHIRDGKSDFKMVVAKPTQEFQEQINSETLELVEEAKTGLKIPRWIKKHDRNHYFDCMAMACVAANMRGLFNQPIIYSVIKPSESKTEPKINDIPI